MSFLFLKSIKRPLPWLIATAAVGLVGLAMAAPAALKNFAPKPREAKELTVTVQPKTVTTRISTSGEVIPVKTVNLNPKTAGVMEKRWVKQGDSVEAGQLIAQMERRNLEAQMAQVQAQLDQTRANLSLLQAGNRPEAINQAKAGVNQAEAQVGEADAQIGEADAAVLQAEAQLAQSTARLNKAQFDLDRNNQLRQEGVISENDLEKVRQDYAVALAQKSVDQKKIEQAKASRDRVGSGRDRVEASLNSAQEQLEQQKNGPREQEIEQAQAQVKAAEAQVQAIQTQLDDTDIRAPFAGVITQTGADEGAFVTPTSFSSNTSSATFVATLASELEILARVPEVDIGQVKPGQKVEIRSDAYPKETFQGIVRLVAPEAKEDTTQRGLITFEVRVSIVTGADKLRSKMTTDVVFLGKEMPDTLMVPTVAIVTKKGQTGVLIPDEKTRKPTFKPVKIGASVGNETQVIEGLQTGDAVFVELPEGQKLESVIKEMDRK